MTQIERMIGPDFWRPIAQNTLASWREMFERKSIVDNLLAGVTVAFVALPLNLALAIACGLPASAGLVTAAVAGALGALFGGARLQVTGPEVALVPLTYEISQRYGIEGLIWATFLCGVLQILFGIARLGRLIHAIPVSVIGGFMAAVGILVFNSQVPRLLGLPTEIRLVSSLRGTEWISQVNLTAVALGALVMAGTIYLPKLHKRIPAGLLALVAVTGIVAFAGASVAVVGPLDGSWPAARLPQFGKVDLVALFPEALALALLASIDSLLSAVAIDAQSKAPRHSSEQELVAQGVANIACSLFGGMPAAGAIVRSSAAVQSGATTRLPALTQSALLLVMFFLATKLVGLLPLTGLAGILLVVGYRLINFKQLRFMWKVSRFESVVFVATALSILVADFVDGVMMGLVLSLVHFAHVQRRLDISLQSPEVDEPGELSRLLTADGAPGGAIPNAAVIRLEGPIFFASHTGLERLGAEKRLPKHLIFDLSGVPLIDYTGIEAFRALVSRLGDEGTLSLVARPSKEVAASLSEAKVVDALEANRIFATIAEALEHIGETAVVEAPLEDKPKAAPMRLRGSAESRVSATFVPHTSGAK